MDDKLRLGIHVMLQDLLQNIVGHNVVGSCVNELLRCCQS